jgi:hypothetical protein
MTTHWPASVGRGLAFELVPPLASVAFRRLLISSPGRGPPTAAAIRRFSAFSRRAGYVLEAPRRRVCQAQPTLGGERDQY